MKILVDDMRDSCADIICRNSAAAKKVLPYVQADILYLDFDLGDGNGANLLKWLGNKFPLMLPAKVTIVSSSPDGREKIKQVLLSLDYVRDFDKGGSTWVRS